ncbi:hypothetical protein F4054_05965 [Candidatus Poribacteria bacterium]|nr:hypothetical protein [Candidatus Poribacteria bacterium]MYG08223.1 hypothetical protein [Candidatus Poribacteria bacterium]MYK21790.1 hypothetical protein [Candidatus Poribacteria bacterium]
MNLLKKNNLFFIGVLVGCLFFSGTPVVHTPVAHGFITGAGSGTLHEHILLIRDIFQPRWKIGYRYGADCQPAERQNGEALQEAITGSLRVWLQPLKELQLGRPIVDKFVYELQPDRNPDQPDDLELRRKVNLQVTFECTQGRSVARRGVFLPPAAIMRMGTKITPEILTVLLHELGHAFGLADTYAREFLPSIGGLRHTEGIQPASVMAMSRNFPDDDNPSSIGEDDKRGIIWLYRFFHDKQVIEDCFFADYVYIKELDTCRPKHPLIFEAKHNPAKHTLQILKDDPNLNVNAQDVSGMTALHYAVLHAKVDVVKALLAHEKIKPLLKNKEGETALDLALEANNPRIIALFPKQKENTVQEKPRDVAPGTNLTTTWGAIKQR